MRRLEQLPVRLLLAGVLAMQAYTVARGAEENTTTLKLPPIQHIQVSPDVMNLQNAFTRVAEMVSPAVVSVTVVLTEKEGAEEYEFFFGTPFEEFFNEFEEQNPRRRGPQGRPREHNVEGSASGVIISPEGFILTNEHVVRGAKEITIILKNNTKYKARVVGKDERTDIAILRIKAKEKLPYATMGNSDNVKVGEWVVAIGSPFGLNTTVTQGIVSAVRQSLPIEGRDYRDLIQTDAAINRGNSGGPLCNIQGEVIGINTAIFAPTGVFLGIGFAIPVNSARENLDQLIKKGKVVRGWLGVEVRPIDEVIAREFGLPDKQGVLVNSTLKDSPAAKAGLQRGDIVREFDGKKIENPRSLQDVVAATDPKKRVTVLVLRNGKEMRIPLVTGEMPSEEELENAESEEAAPVPRDISTWEGMSVTTSTRELARRFNVPEDEKGVVVLSVERGSAAMRMGILPGDLIQSINRAPTPTAKDFEAAVKKVQLAKGVVLDVNRHGQQIYVTYTPSPNE